MVKADIYPITEANLEMFDCSLFDIAIQQVVAQDDIEAVAFVIDGVAIAYGGVRHFPWSMCEGFFASAPNTPLFVYVQARMMWHQLSGTSKRAQFQVNIHEPGHINFAYSLGLKPEGVMLSVGPDLEDCIIFARIL